MIMAQEREILNGKVAFDQLVQLVRDAGAQGWRIDQTERGLFSGLLELGRQLLTAFVAGQNNGNVGPSLEYEGQTLQRLEDLHNRRYVSVFGVLSIDRCAYGTRETQRLQVIPLDARLGLPKDEYSYLLQEWDQSHCVQNAYEQSRSSVERILGLRQSVRALEHMNGHMAKSVEGFRQQQPAPPAQEEGPILVMTADRKGVVMRRNEGEPAPKGRLNAGEKANKKRMAVVGAVYSVAPFVRTADEVVDEVMRDKAEKRRPKPQHKRVRADLTREIDGQEVNAKDRVFGWFKEQHKQRNPDLSKPVVCLMDGERALWGAFKKYFAGVAVTVVCILDLFHMLEYLWKAAHCFFPENSPEAHAFVAERLKRVLEGDAGRVIGGLRQMGTKRGLKGAKLKQLESALGYLQNNLPFMHYDQYLAAGYPIASGVAEGACRHLVKDRMELTGMRWNKDSAQAMLDVRSMYQGDDWDEFLEYRIVQENKRLYPYREVLEQDARFAA
jgi:hypothetical protein